MMSMGNAQQLSRLRHPRAWLSALVFWTRISAWTGISMASLLSANLQSLSRQSDYPMPSNKIQLTRDQPSIIAVTGLAAHAFGSWAHSSQNMWLRDYLPKDIANARILIYGYPSQLQGNTSRSILSDHTNNFIQRLLTMRDSARVSILSKDLQGLW